jgi:hypothetical protein
LEHTSPINDRKTFHLPLSFDHNGNWPPPDECARWHVNAEFLRLWYQGNIVYYHWLTGGRLPLKHLFEVHVIILFLSLLVHCGMKSLFA